MARKPFARWQSYASALLEVRAEFDARDPSDESLWWDPSDPKWWAECPQLGTLDPSRLAELWIAQESRRG